MTTALITGITGQDGYYLSELCYEQGWDVYGLVRGQDNPKATRLTAERPYVRQLQGDLADRHSIAAALDIARPDYVFNLGAITYIPLSWQMPELVHQVNFLGVQYLLDECSARNVKRVIQASTSEMFGKASWHGSLSETSPFNPISPYAIAKLGAHYLCKAYRSAGKQDAVSAIMFNHESPRRGKNFVTRKITLAATNIAAGLQDKLVLGNTSAIRDWGYAPEYMQALLTIATAKQTHSSYVIATREPASVQNFAEYVWFLAGLDRNLIESDSAQARVNDVAWLQGDSTLIEHDLGWRATTRWRDLAKIMFEHDAELARRLAPHART